MNIQGYQKLSLLDFPGTVACTVFTGGCNLRCPFCHNASLVENPRENANQYEEGFSYLEKRRGILEGVCVSGGEPLLQADLIPFLHAVKDLGYRVKLDTNGSMPETLRQVLQSGAVDYLAMDIKSGPSSYEKAIGVPFGFDSFRKSIQLIRSSGIPYEFRTTVVKGIHTLQDLLEIPQILSPEDPYFLQGFIDSGNLLGNKGAPFSREEMKTILEEIRKKLPAVKLRGQEE